MSAETKPHYTIGADLRAPFSVTLTIYTDSVDVDRFRADLPRIAAKLEQFIQGAKDDARIQGVRIED